MVLGAALLEMKQPPALERVSLHHLPEVHPILDLLTSFPSSAAWSLAQLSLPAETFPSRRRNFMLKEAVLPQVI